MTQTILNRVRLWFSMKPLATWFLIIVLLGMVPLFVGSYFRYVVNLAMIFVFAGFGMNILVATNQISLGNAAFFAVGAYTSALLVQELQMPFIGALFAAAILAAVAGFIIALPAIRLEHMYLAIATLGFVLIFEQILINWSSLTNGASGLVVAKASLGRWEFDTDLKFFYFTYALLIAAVVIGKNILGTRTGRAFSAIKMSPTAAQAMGINVSKYKLISFILGAFFTGIGGSLYAHYVGYIDPPSFGIFLSVSFLSMVVIGGMGSIAGAVFGALFVTITPEVLVALGAKEAQLVVYGVAMILILRFFPQGIQGIMRILDRK